MKALGPLQTLELLEGTLERRDRFDAAAYFVRRLYGSKRPRVYRLPGRHESSSRRFARGVVVISHSLSDALELAEIMVENRCA